MECREYFGTLCIRFKVFGSHFHTNKLKYWTNTSTQQYQHPIREIFLLFSVFSFQFFFLFPCICLSFFYSFLFPVPIRNTMWLNSFSSHLHNYPSNIVCLGFVFVFVFFLILIIVVLCCVVSCYIVLCCGLTGLCKVKFKSFHVWGFKW